MKGITNRMNVSNRCFFLLVFASLPTKYSYGTHCRAQTEHRGDS